MALALRPTLSKAPLNPRLTNGGSFIRSADTGGICVVEASMQKSCTDLQWRKREGYSAPLLVLEGGRTRGKWWVLMLYLMPLMVISDCEFSVHSLSL